MHYNKNNIINYIKKNNKINKKKINIIVNSFFNKIISYVKKKKIIKIKNFGKFYTKKTQIKKWINPKNKKTYIIYPKKILKLKISKIFKKKINKLNFLKK